MIVKRVSEYEFKEAFKAMDRDQFSKEGYAALYEYLDDLSEDIGEPIELDVIAITCEYTEYESLKEVIEDYGMDVKSLDDLRDHTTVIEFDGGLIVRNF